MQRMNHPGTEVVAASKTIIHWQLLLSGYCHIQSSRSMNGIIGTRSRFRKRFVPASYSSNVLVQAEKCFL